MAEYVDKGLKRIGITISKPMLAIICIVSGITVVVFPNLLVWIVGLFLVIQGALLLTDILEQKRPITSVTSPNGIHCSQCGTSNTEEAVYCKECGKKLDQTQEKSCKTTKVIGSRQAICLDSSPSSNHVHYPRYKQRRELIEFRRGKWT